MTKLLILDSGAFTVWTQGAKVDLDRYIQFCLKYPDTSYYVALDVIPGRKGAPVTASDVRAACEESWHNYQKMTAYLPKEKVLPVYHFKDPIEYLERYLDAGVGYVGIGGLVFAETPVRLRFLRSLRGHLFDGSGRPRIMTHGFGLTSYDVMTFWEWYSVDSTSWKQTGSWGGIYLPKYTSGHPDYSRPPLVVAVTPQSPKQSVKQQHLNSMSPYVKKVAMEYIESEGFRIGEWDIVTVGPGYSIKRGSAETWFSRAKWQVLRPRVDGLATSFEDRCRWNSRFVKRSNKVLPIQHIYFAGAKMPYKLEFQLGRRLLSYAELQGKAGERCMEQHCASIRSYKK